MMRPATPTSRVTPMQTDGTPYMPPMPTTTTPPTVLATLPSPSHQQPLYPPFLNTPSSDLPTTWTHPLTPPRPILPLEALISASSAPVTPAATTTSWKKTATSPSSATDAGTGKVVKESHGALSAPGKLTPPTTMRAGATSSRPASAVGGLTSVDLTSHVTIANLETLMAVSSANTPASLRISSWLSGVSQSEEGVVLRSDPTPTFSHTVPSIYTPTYETPNTWDCITVVSDFPNVVPAHPLDILPHIAPEPVTLCSLMHSWPYTTHCFTEFRPRCTDGDSTELWLASRSHFTHAHTLEHLTFCQEYICPTHFPYGGNRLAK
jgi:hypothetical protein